jgi:hypothetical protein
MLTAMTKVANLSLKVSKSRSNAVSQGKYGVVTIEECTYTPQMEGLYSFRVVVRVDSRHFVREGTWRVSINGELVADEPTATTANRYEFEGDWAGDPPSTCRVRVETYIPMEQIENGEFTEA